MVTAPLLPHESQRLMALQGYQLLDTLPEEEFDEITRLAAAVCQVPIALISLIDDKRQWFKSKVGLDICEIKRDIALCSHTMADGSNLLVVPDTRKDERFHDNPLVTGAPYVAFYAGIALIDQSGYALGSLCVIDQKPRELSLQQIDALKSLARLVLEKVEIRREKRLSRQKEDSQGQELRLLHQALNASSDQLYIIKPNSMEFVAFNQSASEQLGYSRTELLEKGPHGLNPCLSREELQAVFLKVLQEKKRGYLLNTKHRNKEGDCFPVEILLSYSEEQEDLIVAAVRNMETEKEDLLQELKAKISILQQYNYIVSHNLRGPVANILGLSDLLLNMPEHLSEEEKRQYLNKMYDATAKIDEIIQDLTNILALQNPLADKRDAIDFQEMIDSTISSLQTFIDEARADVQVWVDPAIGSFTSLRSYVQSILYNLINNAIKYRALNRQLQISVKVIRQQAKLVLKVSDNGQGINLHKHGEQLFGLYKRFNPYVEGRGLGLHMTRVQVNALGGTIEVESKEGRGTTFTVSFATETADAVDRKLGNQMWIEEAS
jgi:PAS domain S-box-containing protein